MGDIASQLGVLEPPNHRPAVTAYATQVSIRIKLASEKKNSQEVTWGINHLRTSSVTDSIPPTL